MKFIDRKDAAQQLAKRLERYKDQDPVIYALPRGGVLLGIEAAKALDAEFDLLIPRKIGHPSNPEYAIASVTEMGDIVTSEAEVAAVDKDWFNQEVQNQRDEAKRRRETYLQDRPSIDPKGKTAIIIDDGIATGLTMMAAIKDLQRMQPKKILIAVPVAPKDTIHRLKTIADKVIVIEKPLLFLGGIGNYYDAFDQVSDEEVIELISSLS